MRAEHSGDTTIRDVNHLDRGPGGYLLYILNDAGSYVVSLPTSGALIVGRGAGADVRVADVRVSRRHARIHIGAEFRIEDLHSANGTTVGGERLGSGES